MKKQLNFGLALMILAASAVPAWADSIFLGDGAAYGAALPAGTFSRPDLFAPLSYIYSNQVSGVGYTATSDTQITFTSVNFLAGEQAGTLTPFILEYDGGSPSNADDYTLLVLGDTLTVPAESESGGALFNDAFTVDGSNPVLDLTAGETIVAGFYQSTHLVYLAFTSQSASNDEVWTSDIVSGLSDGQTLTAGNPNYNFNLTYGFDVGAEEGPLSSSSTPEPGSLLLLGSGLTVLVKWARRKKVACVTEDL